MCLQNCITLEVEWIPRSANDRADFLSRIVDYDDWRVNRDYFLLAEEKWGPHSVDRFANHENTQLPRFNSRFWCPGTEAVDAFSVSWAGENNWLVSPFFSHSPGHQSHCRTWRLCYTCCSTLAFRSILATDFFR